MVQTRQDTERALASLEERIVEERGGASVETSERGDVRIEDIASLLNDVLAA